MQAARTQFFTSGFSKVTIDELSASLGISKKTLYQHFASKEEVLQAVMEGWKVELQAGIEAIVQDPTRGFIERLHRLMGFISGRMAQVRAPFFDDLRRKAPALMQEMLRFRRERVMGTVVGLFMEGSTQGYFRPDIPPEFFVRMWLAVIDQVLVPDVLTQLPYSAGQAFRYFFLVMLEGILTDTARAQFDAALLTDPDFTP